MRFESGEILGWGALATTAATPAGAAPLLGGAVEFRALSLPLHAREKSHVLPRQVDNGAACAASFLKVPAWARWECAVVLGGGGWVAASSARDLEHAALYLIQLWRLHFSLLFVCSVTAPLCSFSSSCLYQWAAVWTFIWYPSCSGVSS